MVSGLVICGRAEVSAIDFAPEPIANATVSAPASVLAELIASRNEPAPESFTLLTVNVENKVRDSRRSNPPTARTAADVLASAA